MKEQPRRMLPSLDAYLDRIGVCDVQPATLEFLDELIYAHQRTVPFDNLDVYEKHLVPSLQVPDLFDKIVVRKRGGYCFELNALFNALLLELGFDSRPCMARVLFRPVPYFHISHRANFVRIDGRDYLADVGFGGPMPSFALPVEDGATRIGRGQAFAMHRYDDYWWDVGYTGGGGQGQRVLRVCVMPVDDPDFVPLSFRFHGAYRRSIASPSTKAHRGSNCQCGGLMLVV